MSTETSGETPELSTDEVRQFHEQGYLGPFRVCSAAEMEEYVSDIKRQVMENDPVADALPVHRNRHRDAPAVYELLSRDEIVEKIASIYGEDVFLWASQIWQKDPGDVEVPWHQDDNFHALEPPNNVTAWIALNSVDEENGCLELLPGSHDEWVPHVESPEDVWDDEMVDPDYIDGESVTMEMEPGECFIFNERLIHRSFENTSDRSRVAIAARYTFSFVTIDRSHDRVHDDHKLVPVSGSDRLGLSPLAEPPTK